MPIRQVPIKAFPGEFVYVVAEHEGQALYWSDVEDGWNLDPLNAAGGIDDRGADEFELSHIMWQLFGDPNVRSY